MRYPLIKPNPPKPEEWVKYLDESYKTSTFSNFGPAVTAFQNRIKEFLNLSIAPLAFCNATLALEIVLESLDLNNGEVLLPSYTFAATATSIERVGCKPIFVDNDLETWHLSLDDAAKKFTHQTRALILVHPIGCVKDLTEYLEFCNKRKIYLIIDAAASFGANYPTSKWTDATCQIFSHHITKTAGIGEGSTVISSDIKLLEKWRKLSNFGLNYDAEVELRGTNAKMSDFQAAIGLGVLDTYKDKLEKRQNLASIYLKQLNSLCVPQTSNTLQHSYGMFPFLYKGNIEQLKKRLTENGVGYRQYYKPLHWHSRYKNQSHNLPNADVLGARVMCVPCYETLSIQDINNICDIINA